MKTDNVIQFPKHPYVIDTTDNDDSDITNFRQLLGMLLFEQDKKDRHDKYVYIFYQLFNYNTIVGASTMADHEYIQSLDLVEYKKEILRYVIYFNVATNNIYNLLCPYLSKSRRSKLYRLMIDPNYLSQAVLSHKETLEDVNFLKTYSKIGFFQRFNRDNIKRINSIYIK